VDMVFSGQLSTVQLPNLLKLQRSRSGHANPEVRCILGKIEDRVLESIHLASLDSSSPPFFSFRFATYLGTWPDLRIY
jgi:hypothetical protein